ncbi:MAG TPA: SRPBCC family protein [Anaerolineales bacterium]|nr:SRPBCC family protein [Anaerolineales bacterium]HNB34609.1 SRPBCC family protein [Anaerolineales bacterium]HND48155.1 SRPBCC family protein [Anaerolineales bacterium]
MALIETSITINKPASVIFAHLTNLDNIKNDYVEKIEIDYPIRLGLKYKIFTKAGGRIIETLNEVVGFEQDKLVSTKTFAAPPASDLVNTYILEESGGATKVIFQTEALLTVPGMPSMPGMEDMMKKQMIATYNATLAALKKTLEG